MKRVTRIAAVGLIAGLLGCATFPAETTRTGEVYNIEIVEHLSLPEVTVRVGDEVRWTNQGTMGSRIDLVNTGFTLTCKRSFSISAQTTTTTLAPSESASLCFRQPTEIRYQVRMAAALSEEEDVLSGLIRVVN